MAVLIYVTVLHVTWLVNSAAHFFGNKLYDKTIGATENMLVWMLAIGEGFHNLHLMAWIGQAYDLRSASPETVEARSTRTGQPDLTAIYMKKNKGL